MHYCIISNSEYRILNRNIELVLFVGLVAFNQFNLDEILYVCMEVYTIL